MQDSNSAVDQTNSTSLGIVGIGKSGYATATYFLKKGKKVTLFDSNANNSFVDSIRQQYPHIEFYNTNNIERLREQSTLIVSPGIAIDPQKNPELYQVKAEGKEIIGDIEVFAILKNMSSNFEFRHAPVIGITGSNGKTTTTNLVAHLLRAFVANQKGSVCMAGNVGEPLVQEKYIDTPCKYYVLELSSFQLETTNNLKLRVSTVLNVSDDHLDRYDSREHYRDTKLHIYDMSETIVYNRNDENTYPAYGPNVEVNKSKHLIAFSTNPDKERPPLYYYDKERQGLVIPADYMEGNGQIFIPEKDLPLRGIHNYENILAALVLVRTVITPAKTADKILIDALKSFEPLKHRYELVKDCPSKVTFINDSKATNVGSTVAAINSTTLNKKGTLWLLLGGDGKGQDFSVLSEHVNKDHIKVICFGRDAELIAPYCKDAIVVGQNGKGTLTEAMTYLSDKLKSQDTVLLSPACASLDQFKNYEERGEKFSELAKKFQFPSKLLNLNIKIKDVFATLFKKFLYLGGDSASTWKTHTKEVKLYDRILLALVLLIFGIGAIAVISASVYYSFFGIKYFFMFGVALGALALALSTPTQLYFKYVWFILLLSVGALGLVLVIGQTINGSTRWIKIASITVQPVELAKYATFLYLGVYLSKIITEVDNSIKSMLGFGVYSAIVIFLLIKQPDIGSSLLIVIVCLLTYITFSKQFKTFLLAGVTLLFPLYFLVSKFMAGGGHYIGKRLSSFLYPFNDAYGQAYQTVQSLSSIAHGKTFGVGLGNSVFKSGFLTESNTDYILSIIGEEMGAITMVGIAILYILLFIRMQKISHETFFEFGKTYQAITCFAFSLWIAYQALYSFAMVNSFLPVDGNTLPLISYGGSSYVSTMLALGFVLRTDYENRIDALELEEKEPTFYYQNCIVCHYQSNDVEEGYFHAKDRLAQEAYELKLKKQRAELERKELKEQRRREKKKERREQKLKDQQEALEINEKARNLRQQTTSSLKKKRAFTASTAYSANPKPLKNAAYASNGGEANNNVNSNSNSYDSINSNINGNSAVPTNAGSFVAGTPRNGYTGNTTGGFNGRAPGKGNAGNTANTANTGNTANTANSSFARGSAGNTANNGNNAFTRGNTSYDARGNSSFNASANASRARPRNLSPQGGGSNGQNPPSSNLGDQGNPQPSNYRSQGHGNPNARAQGSQSPTYSSPQGNHYQNSNYQGNKAKAFNPKASPQANPNAFNQGQAYQGNNLYGEEEAYDFEPRTIANTSLTKARVQPQSSSGNQGTSRAYSHPQKLKTSNRNTNVNPNFSASHQGFSQGQEGRPQNPYKGNANFSQANSYQAKNHPSPGRANSSANNHQRSPQSNAQPHFSQSSRGYVPGQGKASPQMNMMNRRREEAFRGNAQGNPSYQGKNFNNSNHN